MLTTAAVVAASAVAADELLSVPMAHRGTELNFFGCFSLSEKLLSGFPFSHLQSKEKEFSHLPTESLSAIVLKFSLLTVEVLDALAAKTLADLSNTLLLIPAPFYLFLLTGVCLLLSGIGKGKKERVRIKYSRDSFFSCSDALHSLQSGNCVQTAASVSSRQAVFVT